MTLIEFFNVIHLVILEYYWMIQTESLYADYGLKWEVILSQKGPGNNKLYSFRISKGFRGVAYRDGLWLRLLSLHPDHDSAYQ